MIGDSDRFSFTPSNPWLAVGWSKPGDITLPAAEYLAKKDITFLPNPVTEINATEKTVLTRANQRIGTSVPIYEKYVMRTLGIERLKDVKRVPSK